MTCQKPAALQRGIRRTGTVQHSHDLLWRISHNLCFLVPGEDAEQVVQKRIVICLSKYCMAWKLYFGPYDFLVTMLINKRACTLLTSVLSENNCL